MSKSILQAKSATQKQIKALISKICQNRSTAIDPATVDQCVNFAKSQYDNSFLFQSIFEEIDKSASHQFTVNKLLFVLQTIANLRDHQINGKLRQYLIDIQTIQMLSFEAKNSALRRNIHANAKSLYEFLAYDKGFNDDAYNLATQMTYVKPIQEETKDKNDISTGLMWEDNSSDDLPIQAPAQRIITEAPQQSNKGQSQETDEDEQQMVGPDPFEDFVGYDPFENFTIPDNFSTKLELKISQSNAFAL